MSLDIDGLLSLPVFQVDIAWLGEIDGGDFLKIHPRWVASPLPNSPLLQTLYYLLRLRLRLCPETLLVSHHKSWMIKHQASRFDLKAILPICLPAYRKPLLYHRYFLLGTSPPPRWRSHQDSSCPFNSHTFSHNHEHENFHEHDPSRLNTTHLQNNTSHNISFSEQAPRLATLPQEGDLYDWDSLWGLLNPVNSNQVNLFSIFSDRDTLFGPQNSMQEIQKSQRISIEEIAILQVLSSARDPSSMQNDVLSTINSLRFA
jgi:hypothetical protein